MNEIKTNKNQSQNFIRNLSFFFLKILLPPWSPIWLIWIISTIFVFFSRGMDLNSLSFSIEKTILLLNSPTIFEIWLEVTIILIINYTFNFFVFEKYPKLQYFFAFTSLVLLFFLFINLMPFVIARIGNI